jgi:hypothetical protein
MTTYLLDADVFIQAKNAHYGFDIVPAFWNWLDQAHATGTVYTVEKVAEEVMAGGDDLATWMKNRPKSFKVAPTNNDQPSLTQLAAWATNHATYSQGAVARFLAVGDYYLVAQAHSLGYAVVTHETPAPSSKNQIKVPDACNAFGVPWFSPFQMLKNEHVQFVLHAN